MELSKYVVSAEGYRLNAFFGKVVFSEATTLNNLTKKLNLMVRVDDFEMSDLAVLVINPLNIPNVGDFVQIHYQGKPNPKEIICGAYEIFNNETEEVMSRWKKEGARFY